MHPSYWIDRICKFNICKHKIRNYNFNYRVLSKISNTLNYNQYKYLNNTTKQHNKTISSN